MKLCCWIDCSEPSSALFPQLPQYEESFVLIHFCCLNYIVAEPFFFLYFIVKLRQSHRFILYNCRTVQFQFLILCFNFYLYFITNSPNGLGTLEAQLLYVEYALLYNESVSGKLCMRPLMPLNWAAGPKPFLKSTAAAAAAFIAFRSRFRHLARRFLNHTCELERKNTSKMKIFILNLIQCIIQLFD